MLYLLWVGMCVWVCLCVCGKGRTERRDLMLRNPQTAHQHKSITIHCGPADLKYNKLSQQVCVWLHVCETWACFMTWIQYLWRSVQDDIFSVRACVCVCIFDIWQRALIPYRLLLCFVGSRLHYAASDAAHFLCPTVIRDFTVTSWTAVSLRCYGLFPGFVLPFRAISEWLETAPDCTSVERVR